MPVAGPVAVVIAFVRVAVAVAWQTDLVAVAAWRMHLVARRMAVAVVEAAGFGKVAAQLSGRGSRRSRSVVVGPVAEAGDHNHQTQRQ